MIKKIPNILTMCRFVLIPFIFIAIISKNYIVAFIFLTLSGLTDVLDGTIARKYDCITNFGKLMDPLADKATQIITLIALSFAIIVFIKEAIMIAGASFLYGKRLVVSSRWYGKLTTVLFYLAIVLSLFVNNFNLNIHIDLYIYYIALLMTIFALGMYFQEFYKKGYLSKKELSTKDRKVIDN